MASGDVEMMKSKLVASKCEYNNKYFKLNAFNNAKRLPEMTTSHFSYDEYRKLNEKRFFNSKCYTMLAKWMLDVALELEPSATVICLAFEYLKVVLCKIDFTPNDIQMYGAACISLAISTKKESLDAAKRVSGASYYLFSANQITNTATKIQAIADLSKLMTIPEMLFKCTTSYTAHSMCELLVLSCMMYDDFLQFHPALIASVAYLLCMIDRFPLSELWHDIKPLRNHSPTDSTELVDLMWKFWNVMQKDKEIYGIMMNYFINVYYSPTDATKKNIIASLFDNKD